MRKERRRRRRKKEEVKIEGGFGGDAEPAAVGDRSGTQTLNYSSSSATASASASCCEDEPICFFLSTTCDDRNNNKYAKEGSPCKWYVLQSKSGKDAMSGGDVDDDDDEGGKSPISLEEQICFEADKDGTGKWESSSFRLIQIPSFPSSLPQHPHHHHKFQAVDYKVFVFQSRIYLLGGMERAPPPRRYDVDRYRKDVYHFDTRYFPDRHHRHNGWKKSPDMLSNRYDIAAASAGSKIYLMGVVEMSWDDLPFGEVLDPKLLDHRAPKYCNTNNYWSRELAPLPSCLQGVAGVEVAGVVDFGKKILLYSFKTQQLFCYDIECNCWSVVANNFGFWLGRLTVALGCVFCFGQFTRSDLYPSIGAYDLATHSWLPVEGLSRDGVIFPLMDDFILSANLFHINHNKLGFVWTSGLPGVKEGNNYLSRISLHYSKFLIHKTANCIRATDPSFYLSATIRYRGLPVCVPLNGKCFGLWGLDYYEEAIGGRELILGDTTKELMRENGINE